MSSQVVGVSRLPLFSGMSGSKFLYLCSATSVNASAVKFLNFPYPWIPDSDFVRPSNGYQISGSPSSNYATELSHIKFYDTYAYLNGINHSLNDLYPFGVNGCYGYPSPTSQVFLQFRPCWGISGYDTEQKTDGLNLSDGIDNTDEITSSWSSNPNAGAIIILRPTNTALSKLHVTFYYGVMFRVYSSDSYMPSSVTSSMQSIARYKPINTSFVSVPTDISIIYSQNFSDSTGKYTYVLYRINWQSRQSISTSAGYPSYEMPALSFRVDNLTVAFDMVIQHAQMIAVLGKS